MTRKAPRTPAVPLAPAWGWRGRGLGRAANIPTGMSYQGTTTQVCGLFPYVAGSGSPVTGVPIGRHMLWGEVVCMDPLAWMRAGLTTNPGIFLVGQPGSGKSAITKRLVMGMTSFGTRALILGDTKGEYTRLVEYLGGQVIRVGRGLDTINPLDAGPLGQAMARMTGREAERLRLEIRGRRLDLLIALCTLVRGGPVKNVEHVILGRALDILTSKLDRDPTIPDVLALIRECPAELLDAAWTDNAESYMDSARDMVFTLTLLCDGSLKGLFDGPTTTAVNLDAPAVSMDISALAGAGDTLVAAAMLCCWAYGYACVDAAAALAEQGLAPQRTFLAILDELWRVIRGAPGLVELADALTRLNRHLGMASLMSTHSVIDLEALGRDEDKAKAKGFIERAAIVIMAGLPAKEVERIREIMLLTDPEAGLVRSWAAPETWLPGAVHPGRGKYLIKTGERIGIPVELSLVDDESWLYDTDAAVRLLQASTG
ncbi:ATPase [Longispora fulva]|uniref:Uncharacterized protein n=1 Tax=Longispora fulva TaxID=619741 RepID=A0A8J7KTA1_9ACTN|nr:hypothetical protein [Longispora fulva]MBG6140502.1 hypothetical protein [Longispora fulva]GIG57116.1 ATPase [Longispora fulva]